MKRTKLESEIENFHSIAKQGSNLIIPESLRPFAGLLIAALTVAKLFTRADIDKKIDDIIAALQILS